MNWLKEILSEKGSASSMRLMALICVITAAVLAIVGVSKTQTDYSGLSLLVSSFLTAAMGGKIMQKRIEVDGAKSNSEIEKD